MNNYKLWLLAGLAVAVSAATAHADYSVTIENNSSDTSPFAPYNVETGGGQLNFQGGQFQWYPDGQKNNDQNFNNWGFGSFGSGTWNLTKSVAGVDYLSTSSSPFTLNDGSQGNVTGTIGTATLSIIQGVATLQFYVTGVTYSGSDSDLQALAKNGQLKVDLDLLTLTSLSQFEQGSLGSFSSGYKGSISPVPEVTTSLAGVGAVGLLILGTGMAKRSKLSQTRQ